MEMEQASDQRLHLVLVSACLVQGLRWRMQKLVGQTMREAFEDAGRVFDLVQQFQRVLHLVATRTVGGIPQRTNERHCSTRGQPAQEALNALADDRLRVHHRCLARLDTRFNDLRQIINRI